MQDLDNYRNALWVSDYDDEAFIEPYIDITDAHLYPMLEPGKQYRTFSFDKAVNFGPSGVITGLNDPTNTLEVKYVSGVSMANHTVTFSPAYYDLSGRRVEKGDLHKGIYIHNDRKLVVR